MQICRDSMKVRLSFGFCACVIVSILIIPIGWIFAWLMAAAVHEMGHYAAIRLCNGRVFDLRIGCTGAQMDADLPGNKAELICALAGPLCGSILTLLGRYFPKLAICALVQTVYNILPVYGFDGERALRCIIHYYLSPKLAVRVLNSIEWIVLAGIILLSVIVSILFKWGITPVFFAVILAGKVAYVKIPCKREKQIVQ